MSTDTLYKGYKGESLDILKNFHAYVWSDVEIKTNKGIFQGIILPIRFTLF